jgi:hypothetical protein
MNNKQTDGGMDMTGLAAAIAQGIATIAPKPEIKEGDPEYTARLKAEGFYDEFPCAVFQNGYEANARGLSAEIRERVGQLKPGRYLKGRVTIELDGKGGVHIKYPTSKVDDRFKNQTLWKDFPDLVNQVWNEMHAVTA